MKEIAFLICVLQLLSSEGITSDMVSPFSLRSTNRVSSFWDTPDASWWWNKVSRGDLVTDDDLYYPDKKTRTWAADGSYKSWLWQDILFKFGKGNVIKLVPPTASTTTPTITTTTTPAPTTTTYPPLPAICLRSDRDSLGPFYWPFVPFPETSRICPENMIGDYRLDVSGFVYSKPSSDCGALVREGNAKVEIWLANRGGTYMKECVGFVMTDSMGYYNFTSSMPGIYPGRPQHIHYQVTTQNNVKFVTQMYFQSDRSGGKNPDLMVDDSAITSRHRRAEFNFIL